MSIEVQTQQIRAEVGNGAFPVSALGSEERKDEPSDRSNPTGDTDKNASVAVADGNGNDTPSNKSMLRLQLLYFLYFGATGVLQPFLSLYYSSLGYNGRTIGSLGAITPAITVVVSPLWGNAFDKTRRPNLLLSAIITVSLLGTLLLPFCTGQVRLLSVTIAVTALFSSPIKPLVDSLAMKCLAAKSAFGKVRVFGLIGFGSANVVAGFVLSAVSDADSRHTLSSVFPVSLVATVQDMNPFHVLFVMYAVLHIPVFVLLRVLSTHASTSDAPSPSMKPNNKNSPSIMTPTTKNYDHNNIADRLAFVFRTISADAEAVLFFVLIVVMGAGSSLSENFAFVRIREIGGDGRNMGLCRFVSTLAGIPMFYFSGRIARKHGIGKVLSFSFAAMAVRFAIYGWMTVPYQVYFADMIRGLSFGLFWSASNIHATKTVPPDYSATSVMLLNTCYNGIGRSTGALLVGHVQSLVGTRATFQSAAIFNVAMSLALAGYLLVAAPSTSSLFASETKRHVTNAKETKTD